VGAFDANKHRERCPKIGVPRVPVFHTPTQRNTPIQRNALPPRARAVRRGLSHCSVRFSHCLPRADVRGTRVVAFWVGVLRWVFGVWDPPRAFWVTQFSRNFRDHFCTFDCAISRDLDGLAPTSPREIVYVYMYARPEAPNSATQLGPGGAKLRGAVLGVH
jgi:hypothetical protein